MATTKKPEAAETKTAERGLNAYLRERVPFYAFKDSGKYKDDIVVGVNGRIWRIKRGEQVMIPRYVYEVIANSMDQDGKTADLIASLDGKDVRLDA